MSFHEKLRVVCIKTEYVSAIVLTYPTRFPFGTFLRLNIFSALSQHRIPGVGCDMPVSVSDDLSPLCPVPGRAPPYLTHLGS